MQGVFVELLFAPSLQRKEFTVYGKKVLTIVALSGIICKSS